VVSKYYFSERVFIELNSPVGETESVNPSSLGPYPSHRSKADQLDKKGKMPLLQREAVRHL